MLLGGCFVTFPRRRSGPGAAGDPAWAGAAVTRGRTLVCTAAAVGAAPAPYLPGLLALREGPILEQVVRSLPVAAEVLMVNATGADHPRRCGLATQLGAVLRLPSFGVTRRPLEATGEQPGPHRGDRSVLVIGTEVVGAWLRTVTGARPLAVSPGWAVGLDTACALVLAATKRRRTPEPLRHARRVAKTARSRD